MVHNYEEYYDIIMTGYVAAKGTSVIAKTCREILCESLPESIVCKAEKLYENAQCKKPEGFGGEVKCIAVNEGGIFRALWELASLTGRGFVVDLKKMRIRQETIEVAECFDINPYKLFGEGAYLLLTKSATRTLCELSSKGIEGKLIGYTTDNNDKKIVNDDEIRYLESRFEDEIIKIRGSQYERKNS